MNSKLMKFVTGLLLCTSAYSSRQTFFGDLPQLAEAVDEQAAKLKTEFKGLISYTFGEHPGFGLRIKEPKICEGVHQYSGYLDTESDKHFFFWFFESRSEPSKDPLILWLNGGPGCSSMLGLLMELGPCLVQEDGSFKTNQYGWNKNANIIFLDQPINTGFSYGKNSSDNSIAAAVDMYTFIQMFLKKFPGYQQLEFHIFGESYGGHYVPDIAAYINEMNRGGSTVKINLASIGIGNGDTDPLVQYGYYSEMACNNTYGPILKKSECLEMQAKFPSCRKKIEKCYALMKTKDCVKAEDYCEDVLMGPFSRTKLNPYDIRRKCGENPLCYDEIATIEKTLREESIREELGAKNPKDFKACSGKIGKRFYRSGDQMYPLVEKIPQLLSSGIRVLIYAGDADFICNWLGNKAWTLDMEWEGHDSYNRAIDKLWVVDYEGEEGAIQVAGGEVRSAYNLTFLRIFSAGHMVPYDQPQIAQIMFDSWLNMSLI